MSNRRGGVFPSRGEVWVRPVVRLSLSLNLNLNLGFGLVLGRS
jgi:hypothetical protein